jgi:NAD(P)-dependent dehydrogenase (short-subunit alcohol dehydrogenase family)
MGAESQVVLITGATGPLGRAAATRFAADGARIALVGTSLERLEAAADGVGIAPDARLLVPVDLRSREAADAMASAVIARFGRIDVLLHLVGGWAGGTAVVDLDPDEVRGMLDQHLWTTLHALAAVVPGMVERGFGRVAAVSSPLAANPGPRGASYAMAKAAEEVLLRSLAREVGASGVTANVVLVRAIDDASRRAPGSVPAKGATSPEAIADVLAFLASPAAASVNGQRIALEGHG